MATPAELAEVVARFAAGTGPVALDAERASGYRYSQRAYLVQLRRAGAGTTLIDPLPLPDLSALDEAIGDAEWVLHAASQDLPCLAEVGLRPRRLFDTELAARLAGFERVGLAALTEQLLGYTPGEAPLGGGLVHPAAAGVLADATPRWTSSCSIDLRDALDAELHRAGQVGVGGGGVRRAGRLGRARRRVRGRAVAAHLRHPPGARRAGAGPGPGPLVRPGPDRRPTRRRARPGAARLGDHRRRRTGPEGREDAADPARLRRAGRCAGWPAPGWTRSTRPRQLPDDALPVTPPVEGPPPPHRWAERDPVAAGPAGPLPGGGDPARR